jgi:hypothetical protein
MFGWWSRRRSKEEDEEEKWLGRSRKTGSERVLEGMGAQGGKYRIRDPGLWKCWIYRGGAYSARARL